MMKKLFIPCILAIALVLICIPALADDVDWKAERNQILLSDLQSTVGLSDAQMTQLGDLSTTLHDNLVQKAQEIGEIILQIRALKDDWQNNFDEIVHLEFQIYVKEYEAGQLRRQFSDDVDSVLTDEQADYKPLVMRILDKVYRFHFRSSRDNAQGRGNRRGSAK